MFKSIEPKAFQKSLAKSQKQDNEPGVAAILAASISKSDDEGDTGGEEDGGVGNASEIKESFGVKGRKVFSKTMKKMLELLCNEAGFLVNMRSAGLLFHFLWNFYWLIVE